MSFKPITVSQLSTYVKQIFDAEELLHGISVVGEISGWSNVRGTAYFTLKDESSALSCVCFTANDYAEFQNGDSVMLIGSVKYYTKSGKLNFNVVKMQHYGESVLYKRFLELKQSLEIAGYFDSNIKKQLPQNIKRIGVVSSEGGAVIQDIINVRTRRNPYIDIVLYPVKVQGVDAEYEIAHGVEILDNYNVDVIVIARGGGSFEDLQPFNTKIVADAVYNCKKPIVSAVGHETDFTIADFCSDLRAPTPSAAAELLCEDINLKKDKTKRSIRSFVNSIQQFFDKKTNLLKILAENLSKEYSYIYENCNLMFNNSLKYFLRAGDAFVVREENTIEKMQVILNKLNPAEVLKLGYAFVKSDLKHINSIKDVEVNDNLEVILKDGTLQAKVINKKENV